MAPTNTQAVHQTSLLHIENTLDRLGLLSPTHDLRSQQQTGQIPLKPVLIDESVQVSQGHTLYKNKEHWHTEVNGGGGMELVNLAREPASSRPKSSTNLVCSPLLVALEGRKGTVVRHQLFPQKPPGLCL